MARETIYITPNTPETPYATGDHDAPNLVVEMVKVEDGFGHMFEVPSSMAWLYQPAHN